MVVPPERAEEESEFLESVRRGERIDNHETERLRKDGTRIAVSLTISPIKDSLGRIRGASAIARDITERKRIEERIRYLAQHDSLTGLPNRLLFRDRVGQAIAQARRNRKQLAVLFLDLDDFKQINDSLGHEAGDHLLRLVARRLQGCVREGDSVARMGGDEFVICLSALEDSNDAMLIAGKILSALREPFSVENNELRVCGSIGISLYSADGENVDALMRAADTAMYHAKSNGRNNYQFFTPRLNDAVRRRLRIANFLHHALERDEFVLHYQPQVDLETGRVFAAEALLRWRQPELGSVSPAEFVRVAEETGLIVPLGEWVLRRACEQLRRWRSNGYPELRIAVNLSSHQFRRAGFPELAESILRQTGVPAAALELELTESVLMVQGVENIAILDRLVEMGVHLAVDDFGTGYSSLAYLQRFPIHTLKIDRSFVDGIDRDPNDTAIITAIIAMAHSLRLKVIAEGVESESQAEFLKARGCIAAQGFYCREPVPAEAFEELLGKQSLSPRGSRHNSSC
jgi:diguanylate cyclase (GGDEF)-like protein